MKRATTAIVLVGLAAAAGCEEEPTTEAEELAFEDETSSDKATEAEEESDELDGARDSVQDAADVLADMKKDSEVVKLLKQSQGVFLVPSYGRAAAGVGARGGEGVLLAHRDGDWSNPVFYDIGGISVGAQLGAEGGDIAMLLMSEQALHSFMGDNTFSLNAGAKLTLVDYSELARASAGKDVGDVVFWSDTEGAFAGATLSATQISWDDEENPAYYGTQDATADAVLNGKVEGPKNTPLAQALASL